MATKFSASENKMNLSVLQNKDPFITRIEDSASQVAAYSFNSLTNEWEKTNIEGTLFVYTRSAAPTNGFTIMNRLHPTDLVEPINKNLEFQLQDPFLLYRNSKSAIYGIWFYDRDECARIGQLMNSLVQETGEDRERRGSGSPSKQAVDILQLLSRAQDEYDKTKQGEAHRPHHKEQAFNSISFSEKSTSSELQHPTATHINLDVLFKRAQQHNNNQPLDQKFKCGGTNSAFHLPPANLHKQPTPTVEEIERGQRPDPPKNTGSGVMRGLESPNTTLKRTLNIAPVSTNSQLTTPTNPSKASKPPDKKATKGPQTSSVTTNSLVQALFTQQKQQQSNHSNHSPTNGLPYIPSHIKSHNTPSKPPSSSLPTPSLNPLNPSLPTPSLNPLNPSLPTPSLNHLNPSLPTPSLTPLKPSLPTPSLNPLKPSLPDQLEKHLPSWIDSEKSVSTLLSPLAFQVNSRKPLKQPTSQHCSSPSQERIDSKPLNKDQLKQALISLLKSDSGFLAAIHAAYIDTLNNKP